MFATCSCPLCPAWWRGCCWGWRRSSRCFPPSSFRYTQPALWGSDCPWCPHRPGNSTPAETCLKYQYFCLLSNTQNTGVFSERRPTVIARDFYSNIKLINLPRRRPEMQIFVFFLYLAQWKSPNNNWRKFCGDNCTVCMWTVEYKNDKKTFFISVRLSFLVSILLCSS